MLRFDRHELFAPEASAAFSKDDIGKVVSIRGDKVKVDGRERLVLWDYTEHHDCEGKILSVEEKLKGAIQVENGIVFENPSKVKLALERGDDKTLITSVFSEVTRVDESVPLAVGETIEIPIRPHLQALRQVRNPIMHENLLDFEHHAAFDVMERALFCNFLRS